MKVLMPLPDRDHDVTEVAVPWHVLTRSGHQVVFATEVGSSPHCDPLLLSGVIFGQLGADAEACGLHAQMAETSDYRVPQRWDALDAASFDALFLPGGHAAGMRQYLESTNLRSLAADFVRRGLPVAAICHGVLVLARTRMPESDQPLLHGRRVTCLPKYMERTAWWLTAWKLGRYYRTYPAYVEDEVRAALGTSGRFERGPIHLFARGSDRDHSAAHIVEDGQLITARWPGDAWAIAKALCAKLSA